MDESSLPENETLLLGYIRFVYHGVLYQELAIALSLDTNTRDETVFQKVKTYSKKNQISLTSVIACVADCDPSMIGRYRGFIELLKAANPHLFRIQLVIHGQHLVEKNMSNRLNLFLKTVIKAVNKIKAQPHRLFKQLCNENNEAFKCLLLLTKVKRSSKGNCLARFYSLLDAVIEFLQSCNLGLTKNVIFVKNDIAYFSEIFAKFNELNLCLQVG